MLLRGKVHKFGDDINTDYIIAAHTYVKSLDMKETAKHVFEDIDPGFAQRVRPGDIVVADRNFGCGSSRETAAHVLKTAGISCVLAQSFARIFFRNAINIGLPLVECDTSGMEAGDDLEVDLVAGTVRNLSRGNEVDIIPLPEIMMAVLQSGGITEYVKEHGDLVLPEG
ncbi:MAG: 3-isopropylmalate dehydratase small subunit [Chloroflexota bacterium]